ncbi:MAG: hypothetical protein H6737_18890 [Alphaproteobacteria bacterium]|nr:hypothetical protein [Alphaproteobacteria bacterium]
MTAIVQEGERRAGRLPVGCSHCGSAWLGEVDATCLVCGTGRLEPRSVRMEGEPELAVPFAIDAAEAAKRLRAYVDQHVMPVGEAERAGERLQAHFVPAWLVDARVITTWEAEVGFDYEVESTVEKYQGNRWVTVPTKDRRIRWEPRAGTLDRWYDNEDVPAMSTWKAWREVVRDPSQRGPLKLRDDAPILLPDLTPEDAWPSAEVGLKKRIGLDVQRATQAQHFRELYVAAQWEGLHWSWLLFPVYAASYTDPTGRVRVLRVDGVSGEVTGAVAASPSRARFRAMLWASLGLVTLGLAAIVALPGIIFWPLLLLTAFGGVVGFLFLGVAVIPLLRVRGANAALPAEDPFIPRGGPSSGSTS